MFLTLSLAFRSDIKVATGIGHLLLLCFVPLLRDSGFNLLPGCLLTTEQQGSQNVPHSWSLARCDSSTRGRVPGSTNWELLWPHAAGDDGRGAAVPKEDNALLLFPSDVVPWRGAGRTLPCVLSQPSKSRPAKTGASLILKSNSARVLSPLLADFQLGDVAGLLLHLAVFLVLSRDPLILWIVRVSFYLLICFPLMPAFFHLPKAVSPLPSFPDQLSL